MERVSRVFLSDVHHLAEMRHFVRQTCQSAWGVGATEETLNLLELAVSEAATNIVLHAYKGACDRPIELVVAVEPEQVTVSLFHYGLDFDRNSVPPPVFDGRESGYGLYLINQAVDELSYFHDDCGRSGIRLVKKRAKL